MHASSKTHTLILLLVTIAAGWLYSYSVQGPGIDREVFRYAGMSIANGGTPYITFFDHKPPLIYFIYLLAHPFGIYGPQIVFSLLAFLTALLVYQCCRKWAKPYALLLTLLWIAMMHDPLVMADGGQNRQFSALVVTALFSYARLKHDRLRWMVIGLGLFLVCFTQFTDLPALLPFVAFLLFREKSSSRIKLLRTALVAVGFLLPAALLLGWLYARGALPAFFYEAFTFNNKWYIESSLFAAKAKYIVVLLIKTAYFLPLILLPLLLRTKYKVYALVILACAVIQAVALVPGYFFNHYFISCIPYAFAGWVLLGRYATTAENRLSWKTVLPVVLVVICIYSIKPWNWLQKNTYTAEKQMIARLEPYARSVQHQRGQLFGLDMTAALSLNASYNIISPSKWLYVHFWLRPGWDTTLQQFRKEILLPLDTFRCRYVLDRDTDIYNWRPDMQQLWQQYIAAHYHLVLDEKNAKGRILYRLWERNP